MFLKALIWVVGLLPGAWVLRAGFADALTADPVKYLTHVTGKTALALLAATLAITPVRQLTCLGQLARVRRLVGLFAFCYATVHLLIYFVFDRGLVFAELGEDIAKRPYITVGFTAWTILLVLAATSPLAMVRRLGGKRWQRLHRLVYLAVALVVLTQRLARTLPRSLVQPVLSNDVWQAYQTVRASSLASPSEPVPAIQVIVVDANRSVFVALDPRAFPVGTSTATFPPLLASAARWVTDERAGGAAFRSEDEAANSVVVAERLFGEEDTLLGGVIVQQEHGLARAQARSIAERLTLLGSIAIACIAVIGFVAGRRMIRPLEKLRTSMRAAASEDVRPSVTEVSRLNDEVGERQVHSKYD